MQRLIPAIAIVIVVVGTGIWLSINLRTKQNYARLRDEVVQNSFSVKAMDEGSMAVFAKALAEWEEVYSEVGGPHSNGLEAIGLRPCVANMVDACAYQLPDYSFVSPSRNERATLLGIFQLSVFAPSTDKSLYVSDDGHRAVMRCGASCICVFSDDHAGLRETLYRLKEQKVETDMQME